MMCAALVGLDADGTQLLINGIAAPFNSATPLLGDEFTFAQIVALGGDFYAHFDTSASTAFAWAWPEMRGLAGWVAGDYRATTLAEDQSESVRLLLDVIARDRGKHRNVAGEFSALALDTITKHYPARRYLALSSQNYCHFACPELRPHNPALKLYHGYHDRALGQARAARLAPTSEAALLAALAVDAFGCHFLSDLFASGHMRVPRHALGEDCGILRGALYMSLRMHNEDNEAGLWCTPRVPTTPRQVWRAYGDGMLANDAADCHLRLVREAVRRSAEEVFRAYCGVGMPHRDRADALIPTPLSPGEEPGPTDEPPRGCIMPNAPANSWPLYDVAPSGRLVERLDEGSVNRYRYVNDFPDDVLPEDLQMVER